MRKLKGKVLFYFELLKKERQRFYIIIRVGGEELEKHEQCK